MLWRKREKLGHSNIVVFIESYYFLHLTKHQMYHAYLSGVGSWTQGTVLELHGPAAGVGVFHHTKGWTEG